MPSRRRRAVVAAVLALVLGTGCRGDRREEAATTTSSTSTTTLTTTTATSATGGTAGCGRPRAAGQAELAFAFQGVRRTYLLHVPASYDARRPAPLVLTFHGYGSSAAQQLPYSGFVRPAERDGALVVAPDGQGGATDRRWAFGNEPGLQDDLAMVDALLDHLGFQLCIDPARTYATGMSAGGATVEAIPAVMARWAEHDGCGPTATEAVVAPGVVRRTWTGCAPGAAALLHVVEGGGHTWPGAIPIARLGPTNPFDATEAIWAFFRAHPLR